MEYIRDICFWGNGSDHYWLSEEAEGEVEEAEEEEEEKAETEGRSKQFCSHGIVTLCHRIENTGSYRPSACMCV